MNTENTNWQQSVTGVLIRDNKVLLARDDVPDLTKKLIESAINDNDSLAKTDYFSREQNGTFSLYSK